MINSRTLLLFTVCLLSAGSLFAQSFSIGNIDTATYPSISVSIKSTDKKAPVKENITVTENGQNVAFNLITVDEDEPEAQSQKGRKAICFLIDNSGFANSAQVANAKNSIKAVLNGLDSNTVVDICYYGNTTSKGAMIDVSPEFTADFQALIKDMNNRVYWREDQNPSVDFYKALYESIEFMAKKKNLPDTRQIIVIGTGNSNGNSPIKLEDCVNKNSSIVVNGIGLNSYAATAKDNIRLACDKLKGKFEEANNSTDITASIKRFIAVTVSKETKPKESGGIFYIKYTSGGTGESPLSVKVSIKGVEQTGQYYRPATTKEHKPPYLIIGIVAGVVILVIVVLLVVSGKKKKEKAEVEKQRRERAEVAQRETPQAPSQRQAPPTVMPAADKTVITPSENAASADPRRTVVAGVKMAKLKNLDNKVYNLTATTTSIGRNGDNNIVINDPTVSGRHAFITLEGGRWFIADNNSTNHLYVNGQMVTKTELFSGMQLSFGKVNCIFEIS